MAEEPRQQAFGTDAAIQLGLAVAGFGALATSLGVEFLKVGTPGLGTAQLGLALFGFALLLVRDWRRAESPDRTGDLARYLTIGAELGVLTFVFAAWRLEGPGLYQRIAPIMFVGFLAHHALPRRFRPAFFLVLSLTAVAVIFGLANGALMVAVGLGLIGVCHLPAPFAVRVALLVALGGVLAMIRAGLLPWAFPVVIWPVLASMFMFRLIAYMYDLRHGNAPTNVAQRVSYFFMLPNVLFPLYPLVDPSSYHRRYYDTEAFAIYQRGVEWMLRGVIHLVAYRFIYQRLTISPAEVADTADVARYIVTTFGLYLRVSGQFHLIVGMLHLFGHRLPETHRLYFLASSFTDLWRRINIYWKDFIQKVFFFPVFFRLRGKGEVLGLVVATLVAFFATWLLHAYQWFWILGKPLFTANDVLFWTVLALLVLANSLIERKRGRIRKLDDRGFSVRELFSLGLRTAGTFVAMCLLWTIWNSSSMEEWVSVLGVAELRSGRLFVILASFLGIALLVAAAARYLASVTVRLGDNVSAEQFALRAVLTGAGMAALLGAVSPAFTTHLPLNTQVAMRTLRMGELSGRDAVLLQRGYYENLMAVNRFNSRLWETYAQRPDDWEFIAQTAAGRKTGDFFEEELVPGAGVIFRGAALRVNRWGMRDRDYERTPPPGTYRIAMLGSSHAMGSGVADGEPFESVLEDRLNRETGGGAGVIRYEILNFSVPGYTPVQQQQMLERRALDFSPNAVWYIAHPGEAQRGLYHLLKMVRQGVKLPNEFFEDVIRRAGVTPDMSGPEVERRLNPYHQELTRWTYRQIVDRCRERGIRPVWIVLPTGYPVSPEESVERLIPLAREAGFEIVDLSTVYDGYQLDDVMLASYDRHPNVKGHQLIAQRLYDQLRSRPELGISLANGHQ